MSEIRHLGHRTVRHNRNLLHRGGTEPQLLTTRSLLAGGVAAIGMALFYVAVVAGASRSWAHLTEQVIRDWPYLIAIVGGFGTQVAIVVELRRRRRLDAAMSTAGGVGAGASTVGMVACCAHHLADLIPFIGATGAAAFLTEYRVPFMLVGIGVNATGVLLGYRRLRHMARHAIAADPIPVRSEP